MEATSAWPELNKSVSVVKQLNGTSDYNEVPPTKKMASTSDWPEIPETEWSEIPKLRRKQPTRDARMDTRCKAEVGRLLGERTFLLTKSGSKFVSTGVDPLAFNEPMLHVRNRVVTGYISFSQEEFEQFLTCLPDILQSMEDVPHQEDETNYKTIAELKSYTVLLLPHKTAKFRHNSLESSSFDNVCMSAETLKVFVRMGDHFLNQLDELKRRRTLFPRIEYFASELATNVVRDNGGIVNDECAFYVIKEICNNSYNVYDLYAKYYYHILREVDRIVKHMHVYNNYNF